MQTWDDDTEVDAVTQIIDEPMVEPVVVRFRRAETQPHALPLIAPAPRARRQTLAFGSRCSRMSLRGVRVAELVIGAPKARQAA
jgi:hypothetical protein